MAGRHGRRARILFNGLSMSRWLRSADASLDHAALDATVFESAAKDYTLDVGDGKASCEGFYRGAVVEAETALREVAGDEDARHPLLIAPEGYASVGKRCLLFFCDVVKFSVSPVATSLVMVKGEFQSSSGMSGGVILHPLEAEVATGNEAAWHDNGAATAYGAEAHLHIDAATEVGDESLVSIVQHSVDGVVAVDLITFDAAAGVGSQRKTVSGMVNRYTRERHTVAGSAPSFTYCVGIARLKPSQA